MKNREKEMLKEQLDEMGNCWEYNSPKRAFCRLLDFTKILVDRISDLEETKST